MTTTPAPRRMVDVSGEEAWHLLGGASQGRMMYAQRDALAVRPGPHDALLRIHPQTVTGFRFAHTPDGSATARGTSRPAVS
ncbi:hypothetical protein B7P34_21780 [Streptosporangium nondiastaticum]|uniref:Uncharacterized protein n=1 Tax=Streptosporangium nondiastaticum TaxID=35764 RepID=A0A9X7JN13_9ACTN|nr:hypothetical protein [Streptosporangium nondiastaticum]PSJ26622.1 hypothetical protein B7P34_21780 [Streptosporangium nondiastaticum]